MDDFLKNKSNVRTCRVSDEKFKGKYHVFLKIYSPVSKQSRFYRLNDHATKIVMQDFYKADLETVYTMYVLEKSQRKRTRFRKRQNFLVLIKNSVYDVVQAKLKTSRFQYMGFYCTLSDFSCSNIKMYCQHILFS